MKKRLLSLVLCLVMVFSLLPFAGFAAQEPETNNGATIVNPDTAYTTRRDLVLNKNLTANDDGTFDLKLETFATGKVTTSVVTHQIPTDFILVVDQSGSMSRTDMPTDYQPANHTGSWKLSDFDGGFDTDGNSADKEYYFLDQNTGDYYRVYRKWGDLFELVPRNTVYIKTLLDARGLSWGQGIETQEQPYNSQYYYRPKSDWLISKTEPALQNDGNFYPLTILTSGEALRYQTRFRFTASDGEYHYMKFWYDRNETGRDWRTSGAIWYYNSVSDVTGSGRFGPGQSFLTWGYERINGVVVRVAKDGHGIGSSLGWLENPWREYPNAGASDNYTYAQFVGLNTGMYIMNNMFLRHVGYNTLAYRDANGVEHIITHTDYCNKFGDPTTDEAGTQEFAFDVPLYEAKGTKESRLQAAKNAMTAFVQNVAAQTDDEGPVDHRVAIIGFSSYGYSNTELMTNEGWTASDNTGIASPSTQQYQKALISARANDNGDVNPALTAAIANLTANGGTQPEDGLNMAYNALNNSSKKPEYTSRERNAVVIFFTDGRPGQNSESDQYKEANDVVASAYDIKSQIPNAQIYSVGVFGEADGNPLTYYDALTSSFLGFEYNVDRTFMEKDRLEQEREESGYGGYNLYAGNGYVNPSNYYDYFQYAEKTFNRNFYKEEGTRYTEEVRYRTEVDDGWWQSHYEYGYVTAHIHEISGTFWRECQRDEEGYPAQQNDTIADYMTVVSSTYPAAKTFTYRSGNTNGFRNYTGSSTYNEIIGAARGSAVNKMYYSLCTDSERLTEVFVNIAESIDTAGSTIDLDGTAQLRDIVNTDVFDMPANANAVTAYAVSASAVNQSGNIIYTFGSEHVANFTPTITGDTVSVSGFDYSSHYVMPTPPAGITGQKLIVEIEGLTLKDEVNGEVLSNNEAGIYATKQEDGQTVISNEPTLEIDSPKLTISGAVNPTYIIDFNASMKVATGAKKLGKTTGTNGVFTPGSGSTFDVFYKLGGGLDGKNFTASYSGVDTAMIYGVPVNSAAGTTAAWNKITTVPANNVYFDDDLGQLTAEDGAGYNSQIGNLRENDQATGTFTFNFTGSRIDVYCTTEDGSGAVAATLRETVSNNLVGNQLVSNRYQGGGALYNVPTVVFEGLTPGTQYTLSLTAQNASNYKLDGVRVYNAVAETGDVKTAYDAEGEANSIFLKVRDQLIQKDKINEINDYLEALKAYEEAIAAGEQAQKPAEPTNIPGVLLYTDKASQIGEDDANAGMKKAVEYSKIGPKNEIYLDANQGLSFTIQNPMKGMQVWIGLSAPQGSGGSVKINGVAYGTPISSTVDMYYPVSVKDGNVVDIQNSGSGLISITNVKITGTPNGTLSVNASVLSVADAEPAASVLSVEDGLPYLAVTPKLLNSLNAPAQTEDPEPTPTADPEPTPTADPEPTPTQQPSFAEWISNLFSSFVNALFGSISRLFGN